MLECLVPHVRWLLDERQGNVRWFLALLYNITMLEGLTIIYFSEVESEVFRLFTLRIKLVWCWLIHSIS